MLTKGLVGLLFPLYAAALLILLFALSSFHPGSERDTARPTIEKMTLPKPDFQLISDIQMRKDRFFNYLRPKIHAQNTRILATRKQLKKWQRQLNGGQNLSRNEQKRVLALKQYYEVEDEHLDASIRQLLLRVNVIPEAMVLAQAASESAWGTSRFARLGNNYFGQWCYKKGCGLVPNRRIAGAKHEVAQFTSVDASVSAYFRNINTHPAYQKLRTLRQTLVEQNQPLQAMQLVAGLDQYSQRGVDYVEDLSAIIRVNHLEEESDTESSAEPLIAN